MSRHLSLLMLFAAGGLLALPAGRAAATTVPEMTLREMVASSGSIVHGVVESAASRWNDDRTLIVTDVRIQVLDTVKGAASGTLVVTQPGGQVGKVRVDVDGASPFLPGEEAVLFLAPGPRQETNVLGLSRGRFDVTADPATGRKSIRTLDAETIRAIRSTTRPTGTGVAVAPSAGPLELDEFLGGLRSIARDVEAKGGK